MLRRYTFKLYPTKAQAAALTEQASMCASLWNALLEMRESFYRRAKQRGDKKTSLTAFDQGKDLTELRAACPEWAAMPRGTQERVAGDLDLAMKAFFRRAKAGAGGASGYPKFKSVMRADGIPLREPAKSCWMFKAHSGPAGNGEPHAEEGRLPTSWRLTLRGVPGRIKARGKFPATPDALKTADVKFHVGAWWFSICVEIAPRATAGAEKLKVEFDLIDGFASVKDANGRCAPGLSDPFSDGRKGEFTNRTEALLKGPYGEHRSEGEAQAIASSPSAARSCGEPRSTDAIQSQRDRRFKRGSIRWRREKDRIARIKAREARQRREALHRWTTAIVRAASDLTIIAPPVAAMRTGRGSEKSPGAEVETIAALNRSVRSKAPASAIAMLEYKAAEAAIRCDVVKAEDHQIQIGRDLRAAAVTARKARRIVKRKLKEAA